MLYAVRYEKTFSNKGEERQYQKELSRRLLSHGLQKEYGAALEELTLSYGPHGKPYFQDFPVKFSLSHCPGLVCCGLSQFEIGVDAELLRPYDERLARRVCTAEELAFLEASQEKEKTFFTLWTLKESLMKLLGEGMRYGFQNAAFSFEGGKPVSRLPGIRAASFAPTPEHAVSVCCRGELPGDVLLLKLE